MKNKQFTALLKRTARAGNKFLELKKQAEDEYERRYGANPSDVDDDNWIDSMTGSCGKLDDDHTAELVDDGARASGLESYIEEPHAPARR